MNLMSNGKLSDISITSEDLAAEQAAAQGHSTRQKSPSYPRQKSPSYLGILPSTGKPASLPSFEVRIPSTLSQAAARIPKRFTFDSAALKARGLHDQQEDAAMVVPNSDGSQQGKLSDSSISSTENNFGAGTIIPSLSMPKPEARKHRNRGGGGAVAAMG